MEKYVDERALRHFRDKAVEVDIKPKIKDLQDQLSEAKTSLENRMDNYVEQLCRVETGGATPTTAVMMTKELQFAELYSARLVVWLNGTTSTVQGAQIPFSISVPGATNFIQVSLGRGNETVSGSIALDIMPASKPTEDVRPFNIVASGCVRVGDDVTLVQGFRTVTFDSTSNSPKNLTISITPTSAIGSTAKCGYSYSALYNATSLVPEA